MLLAVPLSLCTDVMVFVCGIHLATVDIAVSKYLLTPRQLIVVHDQMELDVGEVSWKEGSIGTKYVYGLGCEIYSFFLGVSLHCLLPMFSVCSLLSVMSRVKRE